MAIATPPLEPPPRHRRAHFLGRPIATTDVEDTLLRKLVALPVFSSDALSSVAYATEAALGVLLLASAGSARLVLPISAAVALLMIVVVASYRQTVRAYPSNGGAYAVALANLGVNPALVAGAAILIDYLLTVAVSVSAGILAVTSALPGLHSYRVLLALGCVALITLANLRGLRETGPAFALPTYLFVGSLFLTFAIAAVRFLEGAHVRAVVPHALPAGTGTVGLFLVLRAFASGCSALTGVEAIANGVSAFEKPQARNARITLAWLGGLACVLFLGVSTLAVWLHARPSSNVSILAQIARAVFGSGAVGRLGFLVVQGSTLAVLCLAANTSFQGFPRLTALMARDRYMPRQFENFGDRLVYSNGVLVLGALAAGLIVVYHAQVNSLIHLYVVGVFCAFTLSQTGMVRHWLTHREAGWRHALAINATGATATGIVALVVVWTKFAEGAWMVVVAVPLLVLTFRGIKRHYRRLRRRLDAAAAGIIAAGPSRQPVGSRRRATQRGGPLTRCGSRSAWRTAGRCRRSTWTAPHRSIRAWAGRSSRSTGFRSSRLSSPEGMVDAVRERVWALPHGGSNFVTVVIPEQFEKPVAARLALRRRTFRLKLRLLQESGCRDLRRVDRRPVRRRAPARAVRGAGPRLRRPRREPPRGRLRRRPRLHRHPGALLRLDTRERA
jgi:amino acid transporter